MLANPVDVVQKISVARFTSIAQSLKLASGPNINRINLLVKGKATLRTPQALVSVYLSIYLMNSSMTE